jgi:hypothetical protein
VSPLIGFARTLADHPTLEDYVFTYAWLEGRMEACLDYCESIPDWREIRKWPSGRVFGEHAEYRWQSKRTDEIHAVLITDENILPNGFAPLEISADEEGATSLLLWGEWIDPQGEPSANPDGGPLFYTREIPGILKYPLPPLEASQKEKTPTLTVKHYRHPEKGEFQRCVGIVMTNSPDSEGGNR